jgi:hypothetical protein
MTTTLKREYRDKFTFDGRLKPQSGVTKAGVREIKQLVHEAIVEGSLVADAKLREMVTSDVVKAKDLAHLINIQVLPQFDERPRVWQQLADVREVPNFKKTVLYSLSAKDGEKEGLGEFGQLSKVPEGQPYPYLTVSGNDAAHASIEKHGNRIGWTWETEIDDTAGFLNDLPGLLTEAALDTEEAEVFDALLASGIGTLEGGTDVDGTVVAANAVAHPASFARAIEELSLREIDGRKIGKSSNGYNVVVALGKKASLDRLIRKWNSDISFREGAYTFGDSGKEDVNVTVIESERLTGGAWRLLPKPGGLRRPVLSLLRLRGHATPQLRVKENGEFSFEDDTTAYRLRYPVGAARWFDEAIIASTGAGTVTLPPLEIKTVAA